MTENKMTQNPSAGGTAWHWACWWLLGAACFSVSQPLLRIPLLSWVQGSASFTMFSVLYPVLSVAVIGFSAGLFEEGFRFLFKRFFLRPAQCTAAQPLLFGLGHGGAEACIILLPLFLHGYSVWELRFALAERVLALLLQILLTVIVWNGFQTGRRLRYLAAAVLLHGLVDSVLPLLVRHGMTVVTVELVFGAVVLCAAAYAYRSRRLYLRAESDDREEDKEKENVKI